MLIRRPKLQGSALLACLCTLPVSCAAGDNDGGAGVRAINTSPPPERGEASGAADAAVEDALDGEEGDASGPLLDVGGDGDAGAEDGGVGCAGSEESCGCDPRADGSTPCEDECPADPAGTSLMDWYPDCDGDGVFGALPARACSEGGADGVSKCADGLAPAGGWSASAGSDCNDEDPTAAADASWYPDCDGDGVPRDQATTACGTSGALARVQCLDGLEPDGGWSFTPGPDCDDEDPGNPCPCGEYDLAGDGECSAALPRSCLEILTGDPSAADGPYLVDPDGPAGAVARFVTCDMADGGWSVIHRETFASGSAPGWLDGTGAQVSVDTGSSCAAAYGPMLGGIGLLGQNDEAERSFDLLGIPHSEVTVSLDYLVLDSWDGEDALVYVEGAEAYRQSFDHRDAGTNVCEGGWAEHGPQPVSVKVAHTTDDVHVRVTSTLDQPATDEAFGVANVAIRVR